MNIILSLGGNKTHTLTAFNDSMKELNNRVGEVLKKSSVYYTQAWGFKNDAPNFYNQVVELKTKLLPHEILLITQQIELELGRENKTTNEYESRLIDIDILFCEDVIIDKPKLVIPHYLIHKRKFILIPLSEILANFVHPIFQKSIKELLLGCEDDLEVKKL